MAVLILAKHDNKTLNDAISRTVSAAKKVGSAVTVLIGEEELVSCAVWSAEPQAPSPRMHLRWAKSISTFFLSAPEIAYASVSAMSRAIWRAVSWMEQDLRRGCRGSPAPFQTGAHFKEPLSAAASDPGMGSLPVQRIGPFDREFGAGGIAAEVPR